MSTCPTCQTTHDDSVQVCPADGTILRESDPILGRVLGDRYRVLARIGEGGMGTVYRVEHVVLGRRMAVKVLRPEYSTDDDLVRRFQREAVAASRIGQENIVDVVDFGRTREGNLYFVMEELEGVSLATVLHAEGSLPFDRAARILAQVCRALGAAHGHGIVHRDLKPDNVVVLRRDDGSDFVKVVDFGISKSAGDGDDRLTRAGTIIGTPEYMAPEQGAAAVVDHRADVYAFGVLGYEMVTGRLPFQGPTAVAILIEHQTRPPEPPGRLRDGLPPELEAMILKCLEKRPQARYQSMEEVGEQLSVVLARYGLPPVYDKARTPPPKPVPPGFTVRLHTPARSSRGGTVTLEPLPAPSGQMRVAPEQPEAREARRRAGRRLALGVGLLAALAAAAAWASFAVLRGPPAELALRALLDAKGPAEPAPGPTATPTPTPTATSTPTPTPTSTTSSTPTPNDVAIPEAGPRPAPMAARPKPVARAPQAARRPAPTSAPGATRREVGSGPATDDNPYGKLDDLKPDPF